MEASLDLDIVFENGFIFLKLIDYLKNSENAILEFTPTSIKYSELVNKQIDPKKGSTSTNNSFDLYPTKLNKYYYGFKESSYSMYFSIKELKEKIKDAKNRYKIRMFKNKNEDLIHTVTIKLDGSVASISFFKPLNMQNQDFITYAKSLRDEDNPNCTIDPKTLKENCSKIKPAEYKKVTLDCNFTHMIARVISPNGQNGHVFPYGQKPPEIFTNIDLSKIIIDFNKLLNQDLMVSPIKANVNTGSHFNINIPTAAFKGLGKLAPLSNTHIKVFFEEGYLKILTCISDIGHIRTYIGNDSNI